MSFKYPYTNLHELNLDWILTEVKKVPEFEGRIEALENKDVIEQEDIQALFSAICSHVFDVNTAYSAGSYVWHNDELYRLDSGHTAGQTWANTTHVLVQLTDELKSLFDNDNIIATEINTIEGDVSDLKSAITESTVNIWNGARNYYPATQDSGCQWIVLPQSFPAGTYTLSGFITSTAPNSTSYVGIFDDDVEGNSWTASHRIGYTTVPRTERFSYTFTASRAFQRVIICANTSASGSSGYDVTVTNIQLQTGSSATPYTASLTAVDYKARSNIFLESSGDTRDRTQEILYLLNTYGYCRLGKGSFYTTGITMPDGTALTGCGDSSKLILADTATGNAVTMGDNCNVSDLTILGSSSDITLSGNFIGNLTPADFTPNLWGDGDITITSDGYAQFVLATPIPAGTYTISALCEKDLSDTSTCYWGLSRSQSSTISSGSIIAHGQLTGNKRSTNTFTLTETAYSIRLLTRDSVAASSGYDSEWKDIVIAVAGTRSGIEWSGASVTKGIISNCRISRFDCAGIIAFDTGYPTNHNLAVSNCYINNCNVGYYIRKDSEFHKISNCTFTDNYFGYLNRGGNNDLSCSGVDSNMVNAQCDNDEGGNNGHGTITGCSFNHAGNNNGYGLVIKGTGRMMVTGCSIMASKLALLDTNGNVINGCDFGVTTLDITNGYCTIFSGCMFISLSDTTINITNNTAVKFADCWTRTGNAISP